MKKNMSWKFADELSVTFQLSVSGAGEFGLNAFAICILKSKHLTEPILLIVIICGDFLKQPVKQH